MTVSLARMTPQTLSLEDAAHAILAAVASNTLCKVAIGAIIGRGRFAAEIGMMVVFCLIAAVLCSL